MDKSFQFKRFGLLAVFLLAVMPGALWAGTETMTLRINDTQAEPDGRVAVVLRTYAPRGVGQGQICLATSGTRGTSGTPFLVLEEVVVFSEQGDAQVVPSFDPTAQVTLVEFESLSATINWADGPLAVLFFRLVGSLTPGQEFSLEIDLAETFLLDAQGQNIALEPRGGTLTVRDPADPQDLSAEGDSVAPGEVAVLGVETSALFEIGSGQVALTYDPSVAAGSPVVTMDDRHGTASFSVDDQVPGRVVVSFSSPDGSLNSVPGQILSIAIPISVYAAPGTSAVSLDPVLTFLENTAGETIPLLLDGDVLEIKAGIVVFADGFESADLEAWSSVQ